jgi:hypothetical protein
MQPKWENGMYITMKDVVRNLCTTSFVAGLAVILNVSTAHAVDVENYEATVEFAKRIAKCHNMVPPALLVWVGNPKVIVVKDFVTFTKLDTVMGLPAGYDVQQFANKPFAGKALTIRNKSDVFQSLIFVEDSHIFLADKLKHETFYTCKTVMHELMHLYDLRYSIDAGKSEKSGRPELQQAHKEDVIQANAKLKKVTNEHQKDIDYYRYFISDSSEAFAEIGATILYLHPQSGHYKNIDFLFPRLMAMVRLELTLDKIIETGHIGKVRDHLRLLSTLPVAK